MEKYSVLMSLYIKEQAAFLRQSIESMLQQTISPDEIVIVKDGPITKELEEVLQYCRHTHPGLFKIIAIEHNIGLGMALNLGLQHCSHELVARMDSDDISLPERCQQQLQAFSTDPQLALVGTNVDEFSQDQRVIISSRCVPSTHEEIYEFAKRRSAFNHPTVMYKKSVVLACGGYSDLRRNQDVDLFGRMLFAKYKAMNINASLVLFRSDAALAYRRRSWENTRSYIATIWKFWEIGYASFPDLAIVTLAQMIMFLCPIGVQQWLYKTFLRSQSQ